MPARLSIESRDAFVFAACCAYLDLLDPDDGRDACVVVFRPRDPDHTLLALARGNGAVTFDGECVRYRLEASDPVATDAKPERYRELVMETDSPDRGVLLGLVREALARHRALVTEPRGLHGDGVMRYVWDEDSQAWDAGQLVPRRPLDTLYMPGGTAAEVLVDLAAFLQPQTRDLYASLHVTPTRVYLFHGQPGAGKSSLVHCLASETRHNLASLDFQPGTTDEDLRLALRQLPEQCFLCLEDVDCLFDQRRTKNHSVNFSSVLAALDGAMSRRPVVLFLTTNNAGKLDPALRRRVDFAVEFSPATAEQCRSMFFGFYPSAPPSAFDVVWDHARRLTFGMSAFQKFLVRSLPGKDPLACLRVLDDLAGEQPAAASYFT